jgi:hypothetical protein
MHVAIVDAPSLLADVRIAAAGEGGHGPSSRRFYQSVKPLALVAMAVRTHVMDSGQVTLSRPLKPVAALALPTAARRQGLFASFRTADAFWRPELVPALDTGKDNYGGAHETQSFEIDVSG